MHALHHAARLLAAGSLALLLGACARPGPAGLFDDYLLRLARTLDVAQPSTQRATPPRQPDRAALRIEFAGSQLDALDFLALSGCEVQITIGKRNSSLGRMASASQRLLLDLEYLRLAPACIAAQRGKDNAELAAILQSAHAQKQRQLPGRIFLATLGGPEYRNFWRRPGELADYPGNTSSAVITALEAINALSVRWLGGDYRADNTEFELLLSKVNKGDGGALLAALAMQSSWLATADAMLADKAAQGPLCRGPIRPTAADILPNVVATYFAGDIQRWSAALNQRQYALLAPLRALEAQLAGAQPPAYQQWRQARDARIDTWHSAPRRHVQAVQQLLAPCQQ
ncbi:DUF3080 family protein [Parahaliea mediterranea]|uniref:DUF3080 family protein n=1 Tax=Parahaliea mediterranea TaxID=651086 RepID=UPI000E2FF33D|nr:DUF3080 family protein [Parahaliea mediterranea]